MKINYFKNHLKKIKNEANMSSPADALSQTMVTSSKGTTESSFRYGDPELTQVNKIFVEWSGVDELYFMETDVRNIKPARAVRIPWTVKRLRNGCVFSCSCSEFKTKCARGTFINQKSAIVFSKSDEYDQLDGGFDFSEHLENMEKGVGFCNHVAKVVCLLCRNQDDALSRCGIAAP
jgi:hypothetical protein